MKTHHKGRESHARVVRRRPKPPNQQLCGNCGRVLKDFHALQVHRRHCAPRTGKPEHDVVGLVREMRIAFETERRELLNFLVERDAQILRVVSQVPKGNAVPEEALPHPGIEVGTIPPPHAAPVVCEESPSLSEEEIRRIVRDEIASFVPEELRGALERLEKATQRNALELSDIHKAMAGVVEARRFAALVRSHEKLNARLDAVMDEIGFGESMDVAKIPPNILDIVYQATLGDLVCELGKMKGTQEVSRIVESTLENVRMNTSGSELFTFDGRRIVTRGLVESIEQELISARQVQTTYNEILSKLLEHVPGYKPRSFRAMIKIKSQEYAVDMVTRLLERTTRMDKTLDNVMNMVAAFSAQMSTRFTKIEEMVSQKAGIQALDEFKAEISELGKAHADLTKEVQRLTARMEMALALQPPPATAQPSPEMEEKEKFVLSAIGDGVAAGALMKRIGKILSPEEVKGVVDALVERGLVEVQSFGKGKRYRALAPEPMPKERAEPQVTEEPVLESAAGEREDTAPTRDEAAVLSALAEGATLPQMRRRLSKGGMRYTEVLRALRVLIDRGQVAVETRGHSTFYRRIAEERKEAEVNQNA